MLYIYLNVEKKTVVESMGIPLQQIAYTISTNPNSFNEEDIEVINNIIPVEVLKEEYAPCLVDRIKWNPRFNEEYLNSNTLLFLKVWAKNLPSCFKEYVKAYLLETVGFWHPTYWSKYGYIDIYIADNDLGLRQVNYLSQIFGIDISQDLLSFCPHVGSGMLFIIFLILGGFSITQHRKKAVCIYLPAFFCWVSIMIATPVAFSLRYVYILAIGLPLFVFTPFITD